MNDNHIKEIRIYLKKNLIKTAFTGHEKERNQILNLIERTVDHGESNSALLIGPRGAGKTTLIQDVLKELKENKNFISNSILVELNGLIHTDDRLALKSATSQMNLDNAVDGKVFGSFAENLAFLLACLRTGEKHTSKSIVFILEEFDLFCNHHNQTLLYNLFDVSQSAQAPLCIIGLTCRFDVIELLEKRVKSRFSHRQIFLFCGRDEKSDKSDLEYALDRLEQYLKLPENNISKLNNSIKKQWNSDVKTLLNNKQFKNSIQRLIDLDLNERTLKNIVLRVITHLSSNNYKLTVNAFQNEINQLERDDIVQVLQDLTVLELCLIISMKHHNDIYDNQPMNFEMVLSRYLKFANANSNIQCVQRPVILKAFEHIENLELISMINVGGNKVQKEYQFFKLLVTPSQISEAINKSTGLPTEVVQWANSSII